MTEQIQEEEKRVPRTIVLREDLMAITKNAIKAIVLGQFVYWAERVRDSQLFLQEEKLRGAEFETSLEYGWIYKSAKQLSEELLGLANEKTVRNYVTELQDEGFLHSRQNPNSKWDKTSQYRVDLIKIQKETEIHWVPLAKQPLNSKKKKPLDIGKIAPIDTVNLPYADIRQNAPIDTVNLPDGLGEVTGAIPEITTKNITENTLIQKHIPSSIDSESAQKKEPPVSCLDPEDHNSLLLTRPESSASEAIEEQ